MNLNRTTGPTADALWNVSPASVDWKAMGGSRHLVQFYEEDACLVQSVAAFLSAGLQQGEAAVVIATPQRRAAIDEDLRAQGLVPEQARTSAQYFCLDAAATLAQFMAQGAPQPGLFDRVLGRVMTTAGRQGRPVRAFGEMVTLLCQEGNTAAAISLEELWNRLGARHPFSLFCAYPAGHFRAADQAAPFAHICQAHTDVIPAESSTQPAPVGGHSNEAALLQLKAFSLHTEQALRQSEANLQTELADSRLLQAISAAIVSETNMQALYEKLVEAATAIMRSDFASMQMLYPERGGGELRLLAFRGFTPEAAKNWQWVSLQAPSSCGEALRQQKRVIAADVEKCPFLDLPAYRAAGIAAMQSTPLFSRTGQVVGMISTHWRQPHEPSERELRLFDILARQAADVIERLRGEMALRQSKLLLEGQKDAFQAAMKGAPLQEALAVLVRLAVEFTGGRARAAFYQASPDGKRLHHIVGMNPEYAAAVDGFVISGESLSCGLATHTRQPVITPDVESEPLWEPWRWLARQHQFRGCWSFPVQTRDGPVLGTFAMYFQEPHEPTRAELELATVVAHAATIIISRHQELTERERAELALRKRGERFQLLSETLGQLLSARGPETIVRELFPKVAAHLGADTYLHFMLDEAGAALNLHSCAGIPEPTARTLSRLELGQALCGTVAQTRQPLHLNDIQNSGDPKADLLRGLGLQCYDANPLLVGDRLLGTLSFASRTRKAFDEDERQFLQIIAQYAAVALERLQAAQQLEQTVEARTASLREAMAQMEEFSYSVSHDLRAPLRAMTAYTAVLLADYSERLDDTARDYLERIRRSSDRMERLTKDVLAYSRVARSQVQPQAINLERLVRDIIHQYTHLQPPAADIQLASPLLNVSGHEATLGQVVSNLLNNAVKFVAPGVTPHVHVRTELHEHTVRVWFVDNGIGIKPQHQQRIFDMFERIHPEGQYEGTGIGLTIVRKALEKMGGKIGVESDGKTGSRFWFELPHVA